MKRNKNLAEALKEKEIEEWERNLEKRIASNYAQYINLYRKYPDLSKGIGEIRQDLLFYHFSLGKERLARIWKLAVMTAFKTEGLT